MAQVPIGNELPSNSLKSQQRQQAENKKPEIPVFHGETGQVKRTESFWQWMKKMFLSDRKPKDILKEIVEFRIVPGIKDNFRNTAMVTLDSFIYSGSTGPNPTSTGNRVNYNVVYSNSSTTNRTIVPVADPKREEINKGFDNPCFKTQNDAYEFLILMKNYDYPTLSVHTMCMMQKKRIDYTWDAYGWNKEEILSLTNNCIKPTRNPEWPWMIDLPEAHLIG